MLDLICNLASTLKTAGSVLVAFVLLMFMVTIHEAGHYTAGKLLKFKINEFSIGMGPKIFSKKREDGEVFSLRALPLGGFCAFEGEDAEGEVEGAFNKQEPWKRLIVLFSGAFCNFVSAVLICIITFSCYGETVAKVNNVYDYAPTEVHQSLQRGDVIYEINGKKVFLLDGNLGRYMSDDEIELTVIRDGKKIDGINLTKNQFCNTFVSEVNEEFLLTTEPYTLEEGSMVYMVGKHLMEEDQKPELFINKDSETTKIVFYGNSGAYVYDIPTQYLLDDIEFTKSNGFYYATNISNTYTSTLRLLIDTDTIIKVNDKVLYEQADFDKNLVKDADNKITVIDGKGNYFDYTIPYAAIGSDVKVDFSNYSGMGISIAYGTHQFSFGQVLGRTLPYCGEVALLVLRTLGGLFTGAVGVEQIGGPITTISMTSEIVSTFNLASILMLVVLISVNLAVFNLLPVPALDGCRMVFVLIEWITKKPVNRKVEGIINAIGLFVLLGLTILVDLLKL